MKKILFCMALALASTAQAGLITSTTSTDVTAFGFGVVPPVLTLQRDTLEMGCVAPDSSGSPVTTCNSAMIGLGYADPVVDEAVREQISRGTIYGVNHQLEVELAEELCRAIPCAEMVRFATSGMEATALAIRIARAATGRERIVRFEGHFHGFHNDVMFNASGPAWSGENGGTASRMAAWSPWERGSPETTTIGGP